MKTKKRKTPLRIISIILLVITIISLLTAFARIREESSGRYYDYKVDDYVRAIGWSNYGDLYNTALEDMVKGKKYDDQTMKCRNLAFYYEQAVLERAYRETGDTEKADLCLERMKEYENNLGEFSEKVEDVQKHISGEATESD